VKCYVHKDADAVGVCPTCKQGICGVCANKIDGNLYCKNDAVNIRARSQKKKGGLPVLLELLIDVAIAAIMTIIIYALALWLGWL